MPFRNIGTVETDRKPFQDPTDPAAVFDSVVRPRIEELLNQPAPAPLPPLSGCCINCPPGKKGVCFCAAA